MQMNNASISFAFLLAILPLAGISSRAADTAPALSDGAYEVVVNLDLPHLEGMGASKTTAICVESAASNPTHGLVVLSENNPLGHCPSSNVHEEGNEIRFEVHCEGKNAAEGHALYTLLGDRFEGRIDMKMGGKNMTMTETQKGKRTGACSEKRGS